MKIKIIGLCFLVLWANDLIAQNGVGLRSGVTVEKKIIKKLDADVNLQTRFNNDISFLQTFLVDAGLKYDLPKGFDVSAHYRFVQRRKNETSDFRTRHRYYADLGYGKKLGVIKIENRLRYQHQFRDNDGITEFDASYIRDKIEVSFPRKKSKFTPYISNDFFIEVGGKLDQLRPKVGVNYKHNKHNSLEFSIFNDIDLIGGEKYGPVLNIGYKYKF